LYLLEIGPSLFLGAYILCCFGYFLQDINGLRNFMVTLSTPDLEEDVIDFTTFSREPHQLISILQYCQNQSGYISHETVRQIAVYLGISEARVYGVASFYTQFRFEKPGDHQVRICLGTACHVQGGELLSEEIQKIIGIGPGEISPDHKFEFHEVACLGCCAQAPVVEVDGRIYGKMTRSKLQKVLKNYESV
jgi:NADH-quinone oxidoreductase subunit E